MMKKLYSPSPFSNKIFTSNQTLREGHFLTIIVPSFTLDRLGDVTRLLDSFESQTYQKVEMILVIEQSKELFHRIAAYMEENKYNNIRMMLLDSNRGASFARNVGLAEAKGDIVAFVDDDAILFPDWAEKLVNSYEDESTVGVTGQVFPLWAKKEWEWFPQEFDWIFGCSRKPNQKYTVEVGSVNGPNASFRKGPLIMAGGYSAKLGAFWLKRAQWQIFGEETELSLRIRDRTGKVLLYNPQVKVWHRVQDHKLSWVFVAQRAYETGRTRKMLLAFSLRTGMRWNIATETSVLSNTFSELFLTIFTKSFKDPFGAMRRTMSSIFVLFFVLLGFSSPI